MSRALSVDLRKRVVAAIEDGLSCRQAAVHFGVSAASAIRWRALSLRQGDVRPGPLGGDRRSGRVEAHGALIMSLVEATPDVTLAELKARLAEQGVVVSESAVWRFFARHGITLKKSRRTRTNSPAPTS